MASGTLVVARWCRGICMSSQQSDIIDVWGANEWQSADQNWS